MIVRVLCVAMLALACEALAAEVPEQGLRAEVEERWQDAIDTYLETLRNEPRRAELWKRIADIRVHLGRRGGAAYALERVAAIRAENPGAQMDLARAYAIVEQPERALEACQRSLELDPENIEYLRDCGIYAEWSGSIESATKYFEQVLEREPTDQRARLGLARAEAWSGHYDSAARHYKRYLEQSPDDSQALLEHARVEAWRGDYAEALEMLERYREREGRTEVYRENRARFLTWADRTKASQALNAPLLRERPDDYERNLTRTINLHRSGRTAEAIESLDTLRELAPDDRRTAETARMVNAPVRPQVRLETGYYNDSDDIQINDMALYGALGVQPATRITAGVGRERSEAELGSGLEPVGGGETTERGWVWVGAEHRVDPRWAIDGRIGRGWIDDDDREYTLYRVGVDLRASDQLSVRLQSHRELFAPSPRAVSLGIIEEQESMELKWRPDLRYTVAAQGTYARLSDGNRRHELLVSPRRAVLRRESLNLDLGVGGQWLRYDEDLNNGYYDPSRYRRYTVNAFGYLKLSDHEGISLAASAGWHKDENMDNYRFGTDLTSEGTFGLYRDWLARLRMDYSDRYQEVGSYDGFSARLAVTRRF